MLNLSLFLALVYFITFSIGRLLKNLKVPPIFAAMIIGFFLAIYNPFSSATSSETFIFMAELGMYFMLFIVGFELDLEKLRSQGRFILRATFFIILLEAVFGSLLVRFVFGYDWHIAFLIALSFATVGEAILVPILDEARAINTKLGQAIIGIGTLDDIIEIFALIMVIFLVGTGTNLLGSISLVIVSLTSLLLLTYGLIRIKEQDKLLKHINTETLFLIVLFVFFFFIWIGEQSHAAAIAAILAGIGIKAFMPKDKIQQIEKAVKTIGYGFFAPVFFVWVGLSMDINYLKAYPLLILLVVAVSKGSKLLGSYIIAKKELGVKKSILLGIGLSVRFSTSIIIIKILFENGLIRSDIYSILIASSIAFKFIVPPLFANLLVRWNSDS